VLYWRVQTASRVERKRAAGGRSNLWPIRSSAAVLAFVLVDRFAVAKTRVSPPFLRRAPCTHRGIG
jgi:hypothetical protein